MFLTGAGGSGKSHIIHNVLEYAKQFTSLIKVHFTNKTIVVAALTGVAATSILGQTLHKACHLSCHGGVNEDLNANLEAHEEWKDTKMLIVDEISFANKKLLLALSKALPILKQDKDKDRYGGLTVCFAGDFSQLEPVRGDVLFQGTPIDQWNVWVNAFVELKGGHRFDNIKYKELLDRLRCSRLTDKDYKTLKQRVIGTNDLSTIPPGTQIACSVNKDRCAMNNLAFLGHLQRTHGNGAGPVAHTLIVRMGDMKWNTKKQQPMTEEMKHSIYEEVGDYNVKINVSQCRDPFLKLYQGCPVMLTQNDNVECGVANGTTGTVVRIVIQEEHHDKISVVDVDGFKVNTVDAIHVAEIIIKVDSSSKEISMRPVPFTAGVYMRMENQMGTSGMYDMPVSGTQFTFLVNHATTVHKLQGKTVDRLYIVNWSYAQNWVYVALSRVRSLQGLYLRRCLDESKTLEPHSQLKRMIEMFRETKSLFYRRGANVN
jgi:ATP-dependent exoDNAse (exonuclease V) alpha subunit